MGKSNKEGKDQEPIQSSTTPDLGYQRESDNFTIRHHKREPRGQPFPCRCHKHQETDAHSGLVLPCQPKVTVTSCLFT